MVHQKQLILLIPSIFYVSSNLVLPLDLSFLFFFSVYYLRFSWIMTRWKTHRMASLDWIEACRSLVQVIAVDWLLQTTLSGQDPSLLMPQDLCRIFNT